MLFLQINGDILCCSLINDRMILQMCFLYIRANMNIIYLRTYICTAFHDSLMYSYMQNAISIDFTSYCDK